MIYSVLKMSKDSLCLCTTTFCI